MIEIDGSYGEGGGQILRSSLTLSSLTGKSFRIINIRANRERPGLQNQHLISVRAATKICQAQVTGNQIGSSDLTFCPGKVRAGRYKFDIKTAGSSLLVLQTILIPLGLSLSTSSVMITGGTHVRWAPCFHYLEQNWIPFLISMGFDASLNLIKAGYYPRGDGKISATIRSAGNIKPIELMKRGGLRSVLGISAVSNLNKSIAYRQSSQAYKRLTKFASEISIKNVQLPSDNKGTMFLILGQFEHSQCCYFSLGELGKPAEKVADEAVDQFEDFISTDGAVDQYLADQLTIPMCLVNGKSTIRTNKITSHLLTNAMIARKFIPCSIKIDGEINNPGTIQVVGNYPNNDA